MSGVVEHEVKEEVKRLGTLPVLPISLIPAGSVSWASGSSCILGFSICVGSHFKKEMEGKDATVAIVNHGFSRKLDKAHP